MRSRITWIVLTLFFLAASCTKENEEVISTVEPKPLDLSSFSAEKPQQPVHLLFIHHSTGGQLFADKGPDVGKSSIYMSSANGGGLRSLLQENNYVVHEASYDSIVGEETDICHWNVKFRDHMDKILTCNQQDDFYKDSTRNRIVMFKSCFPNSFIESAGNQPGDPDSCEKTTANYQATYNALREYFSKQPDTLFVVLTAPPLVEPKPGTGIKDRIKAIFKKKVDVPKAGERIRAFNNWLVDAENGWLKGYPLKNVVVFDYYDILTDHGKSNWSLYPTGGGRDSHPSSDGNTKAAREFIPFLNKTVHRMGLTG